MKHRKSIIHTVVSTLGLLLAGMLLAVSAATPAPDFTLKSRGGENLKLSEFRGDVVMINFWASW